MRTTAYRAHRSVSLTLEADRILTEQSEAYGLSKSGFVSMLLLRHSASPPDPWISGYIDGLQNGLHDGGMAIREMIVGFEHVRTNIGRELRESVDRTMAARAAGLPPTG